MKTFLMCEPTYFDVNYVINPWMKSNVNNVDKHLARKQWQTLYDVLSTRANIKLIEPVEGLPDMVFTANAGLVKNNTEVIISSFRYPERQVESQYFRKYFLAANYQVKHLPSTVIFEGAGDALFDSCGELWLGTGPRSDAMAKTAISRAMDVKINLLELVDSRWYHLDTAFCPLSDGYVIAYQGAFSTDSTNEIKNRFGEKAIWVSNEDANFFSCNAVCLDHEIILNRATNELKTVLSGYNFNVIETDVSEFMKSGGSCKCLTLEI